MSSQAQEKDIWRVDMSTLEVSLVNACKPAYLLRVVKTKPDKTMTVTSRFGNEMQMEHPSTGSG